MHLNVDTSVSGSYIIEIKNSVTGVIKYQEEFKNAIVPEAFEAAQLGNFDEMFSHCFLFHDEVEHLFGNNLSHLSWSQANYRFSIKEWKPLSVDSRFIVNVGSWAEEDTYEYDPEGFVRTTYTKRFIFAKGQAQTFKGIMVGQKVGYEGYRNPEPTDPKYGKDTNAYTKTGYWSGADHLSIFSATNIKNKSSVPTPLVIEDIDEITVYYKIQHTVDLRGLLSGKTKRVNIGGVDTECTLRLLGPRQNPHTPSYNTLDTHTTYKYGNLHRGVKWNGVGGRNYYTDYARPDRSHPSLNYYYDWTHPRDNEKRVQHNHRSMHTDSPVFDLAFSYIDIAGIICEVEFNPPIKKNNENVFTETYTLPFTRIAT